MIMAVDTRIVDQSIPYLYSQKVAIGVQEDHLKEYDPAIVRMNPKGTPIISKGSAVFPSMAFPSSGKGSPQTIRFGNLYFFC